MCIVIKRSGISFHLLETCSAMNSLIMLLPDRVGAILISMAIFLIPLISWS